MPTRRAALYARYSSESQTAETIQTQLDIDRRYCADQGLVVVAVFADEARSGTTLAGREQFRGLVEAARRGEFEVVVAYKFDRLGRSFPEMVAAVHELEQALGLEVHSATESNAPLVRNILLSVADDFSRQLGRRVHDALFHYAAQGYCAGGARTYGYRSIPAPDGRHRVYEIHPDEAAIVRRIWEEYALGQSVKRITHGLNAGGTPSPKGGTWDTSTVTRILHNEGYRGWRIWNRTRKVRQANGRLTNRLRPRAEWVIVEGAHPAIIDDELWQAVERVRQRRQACIADGGSARSMTSQYLLTGLLKCGQCGGNYVLHAPRGPRAGKPYYRCGIHQRRGEAVCGNRAAIARERIETAVVALLADELLTKATVEALVEEVREAWGRQDGEREAQEAVLAREARRLDREVANLVAAVRSAGLSPALRAELEAAEAQRAALEARRLEIAAPVPLPPLPSRPQILAALEGLRCVLDSGTVEQRRYLIADQIEALTVLPDGEVQLQVNPLGWLELPPSADVRMGCQMHARGKYSLAAGASSFARRRRKG